jgi:hypothetical protein
MKTELAVTTTTELRENRAGMTTVSISVNGWKHWLETLRSFWRRWHSRAPRQLRLAETLALGERRFLVVVEFGPRKFLIGTSGSAMTLLTELERGKDAAH